MSLKEQTLNSNQIEITQKFQQEDCKLFIHLRFHTNYGENIYVVGNHPQLGNWNIDLALKFETNQLLYPYWTSPIQLILPEKYQLQFKIVIVNDYDKTYRWENISKNRFYNCQYKKSIIVIQQDSETILEKKIQKFSDNEPNLTSSQIQTVKFKKVQFVKRISNYDQQNKSEFTLSEADDLDKIFNDSNNYSQSSSSISKVYSKNYRDYRRICNDKYTVQNRSTSQNNKSKKQF